MFILLSPIADILKIPHENRTCQNLWSLEWKRANPRKWICPYWKNDITNNL